MASLERIILRGYKSIRQADIELRPLNVLIGSNGAGKSNLVSFFKLLNEMMGERLQQFIASSGRAAAMLHFGPKVTPQLEARLEFRVENGRDTYHMRLFHAAGDTLVFAEENLSFLQEDWEGPPKMLNLGAGHQETGIRGRAEAGEPTAKVFRHLLSLCRVYHFHDTSSTSRVRQHCYVGDDRWLMPDAGNLAAVLYPPPPPPPTAREWWRLRISPHSQYGPSCCPVLRRLRIGADGPPEDGYHSKLARERLRPGIRAAPTVGWNATRHLPDHPAPPTR